METLPVVVRGVDHANVEDHTNVSCPCENKDGRGAGVLVHNNQKVLLVLQQKSRMWSFPKGVRYVGECDHQCWQRELKEETGLVLSSFILEGDVDALNYNVTFVRVDDCPAVVPKDTEIVEAKWVNIHETKNYRLNAVTRISLEKFWKKRQSPYSNFRKPSASSSSESRGRRCFSSRTWRE